MSNDDKKTAEAFATSWNNLPAGSVYTVDQFEDWFAPVTQKEIQGRKVLELGCGNGSLLVHFPSWKPATITGVDLGASVKSCEANMSMTGFKDFEILQHDLTTFKSPTGYDFVYCIGVLHHLKEPFKGFRSVVENTKPGGAFHCWVYAKEGNAVVINVVDPIRKVVSKLPWWFTKYFVATPLAIPFYLYSNIVASSKIFSKCPLYDYSRWISKRGFLFFRHVAFDQLVTPQTTYISKATIDGWLSSGQEIDQQSTYVIFRNGNSWKFGGRRKQN